MFMIQNLWGITFICSKSINQHIFFIRLTKLSITQKCAATEEPWQSLYSRLQNVIVRISKYKLFPSIEDVDIKDVTTKKWKMQMRVGYHEKNGASRSFWFVLGVQLNSWRHCFTSSKRIQKTQNSWDERSKKPVWPHRHQLAMASQITCRDQGHKNSSTHNVSIVKLKIKRRKINYKQKAAMNNQSQNGIQKNTCEKLQRKTWNRSEAADGRTDWKQGKMQAP